MKAKTSSVLIVVTLLTYWVGLSNASAFYDSGTQRWLNRDPLRERGFELSRNVFSLKTGDFLQPVEFNDGANAYRFIHNRSINSFDLWGLMTDGGINQPLDPYFPPKHPPPHPFDPSCPDDREDLRDCFQQAQAYDTAVHKKTGDHLSSGEFLKVVKDCMKDRGHKMPGEK